MDAKLAAYTARKIVEMFARDPKVSPDLRRMLAELLGADVKSFTHSRAFANIRITGDGMESLEQGVDVDVVTIKEATGKTRIVILV